MRLACLFFACAISFAPIGANAAGAAQRRRRGEGPREDEVDAEEISEEEEAGGARSRSVPSKAVARTLRPGALTVNVGHEINEDAHVTPFPSFAGHAKKALAQNRRDQLIDAEEAARAARQSDRWMTVLFHLRELDSRNDPRGVLLARRRLLSPRRAGPRAHVARELRAAARRSGGARQRGRDVDDVAAGRRAARDGRRRREAARAGAEPRSLRRSGLRHDDGASREVTAADPNAESRDYATSTTTRGRAAAGPPRRSL